jgi:hypothetical protein
VYFGLCKLLLFLFLLALIHLLKKFEKKRNKVKVTNLTSSVTALILYTSIIMMHGPRLTINLINMKVQLLKKKNEVKLYI